MEKEENKFEIDTTWIADRVREAAKKDIEEKLKYSVSDAVTVTVKQFLTDEIVPEITKQLVANKDKILESMLSSIDDIAKEFSKKMHEQAIDNLVEKPWNRREIFKKLFE